jgi:hypothetical protein
MSPDAYVWVRRRPRIHTERGPRSPPSCHTPYTGLSASPSRKRCLLRVLCPARIPVTTLDWVLLRDKSLTLLLRLGPEINSRACLRVLLGSFQLALCWLFNQRQCLFCISRTETPKTDSGPRKPRPEPSLASPSAISFPRTPACPGTQYSPTTCRAKISFNALWHWWTKGDVLTAWNAFSAAWLSEHILTTASGTFNWHQSPLITSRSTFKKYSISLS